MPDRVKMRYHQQCHTYMSFLLWSGLDDDKQGREEYDKYLDIDYPTEPFATQKALENIRQASATTVLNRLNDQIESRFLMAKENIFHEFLNLSPDELKLKYKYQNQQSKHH